MVNLVLFSFFGGVFPYAAGESGKGGCEYFVDVVQGFVEGLVCLADLGGT